MALRLRLQLMIPLVAALTVVGVLRFAMPAWSGIVTPSATLKLNVYSGVVLVQPNGTDSVMELGHAGRDIASTGNIFLRPNQSDAGSYFSGVAGTNRQDLLLTGDLIIAPGKSLCFPGNDCQSAWPGGVGSSVWSLSGTTLSPINLSAAVRIGDPDFRCSVQTTVACTPSGPACPWITNTCNLGTNSCSHDGSFCIDDFDCVQFQICTPTGGISGKDGLAVYSSTAVSCSSGICSNDINISCTDTAPCGGNPCLMDVGICTNNYQTCSSNAQCPGGACFFSANRCSTNSAAPTTGGVYVGERDGNNIPIATSGHVRVTGGNVFIHGPLFQYVLDAVWGYQPEEVWHEDGTDSDSMAGTGADADTIDGGAVLPYTNTAFKNMFWREFQQPVAYGVKHYIGIRQDLPGGIIGIDYGYVNDGFGLCSGDTSIECKGDAHCKPPYTFADEGTCGGTVALSRNGVFPMLCLRTEKPRLCSRGVRAGEACTVDAECTGVCSNNTSTPCMTDPECPGGSCLLEGTCEEICRLEQAMCPVDNFSHCKYEPNVLCLGGAQCRGRCSGNTAIRCYTNAECTGLGTCTTILGNTCQGDNRSTPFPVHAGATVTRTTGQCSIDGSACTTSGECPSVANTCVDRYRCHGVCNCTGPCSDGAGDTCSNAPFQTCAGATQAAANLFCTGSNPQNNCTLADQNCTAEVGETCDIAAGPLSTKRCLLTGETCTATSQCGDEQRCIGFHCSATTSRVCAVDGDCPGGETCRTGEIISLPNCDPSFYEGSPSGAPANNCWAQCMLRSKCYGGGPPGTCVNAGSDIKYNIGYCMLNNIGDSNDDQCRCGLSTGSDYSTVPYVDASSQTGGGDLCTSPMVYSESKEPG